MSTPILTPWQMKVVPIRLENKTLDRIDAVVKAIEADPGRSHHRKWTKSTAIREAIEQWLKAEEAKITVPASDRNTKSSLVATTPKPRRKVTGFTKPRASKKKRKA